LFLAVPADILDFIFLPPIPFLSPPGLLSLPSIYSLLLSISLFLRLPCLYQLSVRDICSVVP